MLQVFTQEKEARPGVAVAASLALLTVAVLMALGTIAARRRVPDTELGELLSLRDWPIAIRCPAGWSARGGTRSSPSLVFVEGRRYEGRRQLQLQRFGPLPFRPPAYHARPGTIGQVLGLPERALEGLYRDLGPAPFGDLPGALVMVGPYAIHLGVVPDGTVYWVTLDSPNPITPADIKLLRDVTASIEWRDPRFRHDASALWEELSFRFEAPDEARFLSGHEGDPDSIICFGDPQRKGVWHLEARPTFLAPGREPADLVRDYLARESRGLEPDRIERSAAGPQGFARSRIPDSEETGLLQTVAVRALQDGSAVMLFGTADRAGRDRLRKAEDLILGSLRRNQETQDFSLALERGRRLAARVTRSLAEQWSEQDRERWYLITHLDTPVGFHRVLRREGRREGRDGFYVDSAYYYEPSSRAAASGRSLTFLSHDGQSLTMTGRGLRRERGESSRWTMRESRRHGESTLQLEWTDGGSVTVSRDPEVDENFLADPLPEWAFFLVATEAEPDESLLVSTSGHPLVHDVHWLKARPIRPGSHPAAAARRGGLGVAVIRDFDPRPQQWYFDPRGNLAEIQFGGGQGLIAVSRQQVHARFRNAGRILAEMDDWWSR